MMRATIALICATLVAANGNGVDPAAMNGDRDALPLESLETCNGMAEGECTAEYVHLLQRQKRLQGEPEGDNEAPSANAAPSENAEPESENAPPSENAAEVGQLVEMTAETADDGIEDRVTLPDGGVCSYEKVKGAIKGHNREDTHFSLSIFTSTHWYSTPVTVYTCLQYCCSKSWCKSVDHSSSNKCYFQPKKMSEVPSNEQLVTGWQRNYYDNYSLLSRTTR